MTYTLYHTRDSDYLVGPGGELIAMVSSENKIKDLRELKEKIVLSYIKFGNSKKAQKIENPHNLPKGSRIFLESLDLFKKAFEIMKSKVNQDLADIVSVDKFSLEKLIAESSRFSTPIQSKTVLNDKEVSNYIQNYKNN